MIPVNTYRHEAVAVLGLGRSGLAAARSMMVGKSHPVVWDDNEQARAKAAAEGFKVADLRDEAVWRDHNFKVLILSPGIPHLYPAPNPVVRLAWKYNVPVDNDISLFFDNVRNTALLQTICVTGSNGKSTTTALIHHILKEAGQRVQIGGNIGRSVLDLDPPEEGEIYVVELSSYQTELALILAPTVAIFLNFSPDHFDRHGGRGGYLAAKARLFEYGRPLRSIIGVDEDEGSYLAHHFLTDREEGFGHGDTTTTISMRDKGVGLGHRITVKDGLLLDIQDGNYANVLDLSEMPALRGVHNHQNACAAYAACREVGLSVEQIADGMKSFKGLAHRMEQVGRKGQVLFVNDSKATNVESASKALASFENIYWIAGGQAKEGGLEALKSFVPRIRKSYLIGEAAPLFTALLSGAPHVVSQTMEQALQQAMADAVASGGDAVVLLSPACASFDQFRNFEERGDKFRELVQKIDGVTAVNGG